VDPEAEIIFGTAIDPDLGDEVKVTVIATGFVTHEMREAQEDRFRTIRPEAMAAVADTELPTFLRRTVAAR
jgi:cell division protein FtsZ